jgi:hypothetical protein
VQVELLPQGLLTLEAVEVVVASVGDLALVRLAVQA